MLLTQHADIADSYEIERKKKIRDLVFEKQDIEGALALLERKDRLEKTVLCLLKRQPTGYYNAFQNISRGTRFIYVHGYQSYLWNRAVSERLRKFGRQVLVGDLAVKKECEHLIDVPAEEAGEVEDGEEVAVNETN